MPGLDQAAYEAIAVRGRSALAWEILRRDPGYRAAHARSRPLIQAGRAVDRDFTARWGLHFR